MRIEKRERTKKKDFRVRVLPSEVVAHEIRVFGEIDGLERESPETLTAVDGFVLGGGGAAAPWLRTPFSIHR